MVSDYLPYFDPAGLRKADQDARLSQVEGADAEGYRFEAGTVIQGKVTRNLNANRYAIQFGDARVVIRSAVPLPVDGSVTFVVRQTADMGARAELELTGISDVAGNTLPLQSTKTVVPVAGQTSFTQSKLETSVSLAMLDTSRVVQETQPKETLTIPVIPEARQPASKQPPIEDIVSDLLSSREATLTQRPDGRLVLTFPNAAKAPIQSVATLSPNTAAPTMPLEPVADVSAQLASILKALPPGTTVTLADLQATLRQFLSITASIPTPDGGSRSLQLRAAIQPDGLNMVLPQGSVLEAEVIQSTPGKLTLSLDGASGTLYEVTVPSWFKMTQGKTVGVMAEAPGILFRGAVQTTLPPTSTTNAMPTAATVSETSNPLMQQAAQALRAEGVTPSAEATQSVLTLAAAADGAPSEQRITHAAHMVARDFPLSQAWLAHMESVTQQESTLPNLLQNAQGSLNRLAGMTLPESASTELNAARQLLTNLPITAESQGTGSALQGYVRTLAGASLPQIQNALASAADAVLTSLPAAKGLDNLIQFLNTTPTAMMSGLPPLGGEGASLRYLLGNNLVGTLLQEAVTISPEARQALESLLDLPNDAAGHEKAQDILRDMPSPLREKLSRAAEHVERNFLAQQPELEELATLREHVSQAMDRVGAFKMENIATLRQDPAYMIAHIPIRSDARDSEATLRFFMRQEKRRGGATSYWNHRVLIDLNTTQLGAVLGDMRFTTNRLDIQLAGKDADTTAYLQSKQGELQAGLIEAGYQPLITFAPIGQATKVPRPALDTSPTSPSIPKTDSDGHVNITA